MITQTKTTTTTQCGLVFKTSDAPVDGEIIGFKHTPTKSGEASVTFNTTASSDTQLSVLEKLRDQVNVTSATYRISASIKNDNNYDILEIVTDEGEFTFRRHIADEIKICKHRGCYFVITAGIAP